MSAEVLVIDDDPKSARAVSEALRRHAFHASEATSSSDARQRLQHQAPDAVILKDTLGGENALPLIRELRRAAVNLPVLVLAPPGAVEPAVAAMKLGATDVLTRPADPERLVQCLSAALEETRRTVVRAVPSKADTSGVTPFVGPGAGTAQLRAQAARLAASPAALLVLGETGVGKGVLARWIHANGPRASGPFVDINCAGLATQFLESELFGHARGAFTGALSAKAGLLEVASNGTVFLDEVGDMPLDVQAKLLKVIEERAFRRMGEVQERGTQARFIFATHRDLAALVAEGRFRSDLYFRISGLCVRVPPLRARADDIPALANELLARSAATLEKPTPSLSRAALDALVAHGWPGNIRELRNVLERAVLLSDAPDLDVDDLQLSEQAPMRTAPLFHGTLDEAERDIIRAVLDAEGGSVKSAAARLGVPRSTLYEKIRRHRLRVPH